MSARRAEERPHIAIAGAGLIGLYMGGHLASAGHRVTFLGRGQRADEINQNGLCLFDLDGTETLLPKIHIETDPACLAGADIVLVAVKSAATEQMAQHIAAHASEAVVLSLQNGISNPAILRRHLPDATCLGAVVSFNVVRTEPGILRKATSGDVLIEGKVHGLADRLSTDALKLEAVGDIGAVQWGKLLANLNNALNALSGLTLLEQLGMRSWRVLLAAQMAETLRVLRAARISPARFAAAPPWAVPWVLRLPDGLFARVAKQMLTIDPSARSSMQDDLRQGRMTEIAALQGEVQRLAATHGIATPVIDRVVRAIRVAESAGEGPPGLHPSAFLT